MKWQNPPEGHASSKEHNKIAESLRARPGEWALIFEDHTNASPAGNIRRGQVKAYQPQGEFEGRSVNKPGGKFDIYARFVGPA